ncbi:MAG: Hsp20/alpha crystallin family protein [Microscillaceae bacterium]|jgi:HSP20 family protein|nr:Hsp20/alpha crystallin family protein [Microscillaceae bacterium]
MTLVKWNTPRPLNTFGNLVDNFFGSDWLENLERDWATMTPSVNVKDTDNKVVVEVAAPGMHKEDFTIKVENDVLNIIAEAKHENETKDENARFVRREFRYESFRRAFTLPKTIDSEKIEAHYENGILTLDLPKRPELQAKPVKNVDIK